MRGMQDGVFGKIHQDGQAVALAAAEHDQIGGFLVGNAQNFRLGVAGFDPGRLRARGRSAR